ncbi:MAG: hypothetical protein LBF77_02450 [Spirochaetaceae bacterium]|jgi:hypothetical protein|nr:hypothetical protein [Spirochaetaceae bacterium]
MIVRDAHQNGLGRIEVKTLLLPDGVQPVSATYTHSGTVLLAYRTGGDPVDADYQNIAVLNDDGAGFRNIFSGVIRQHPKANGIRYMVFADNKRILLGDYILECFPNIDSCEAAKLVPVEYPQELVDDPAAIKHWSEIIIAPDNEHISWTTLRSDIEAAVLVGRLLRREDCYTIARTQIISALEFMKPDPRRPGFLIPQVIRGGEVKQFVRGGTAISMAGAAKDSRLTDSVAQDLCSEEIQRITNTPGYDETTIFSPDERLGLVMSTRASPRTDPAVFGLLPRPPWAVQGLIMCFYMYAVAGVRGFRRGNIGPVLIDIERSRHDEDYRGTALNDPEEEWVYYSPMSWHPSSKKTMWNEGLRGTGKMRIRIAELPEYVPGSPDRVRETPDHIPYAESDISRLQASGGRPASGKIAGGHSGHIEYRRGKEGAADSTELVYVNFSDDGKRFYRGREKSVSAVFAESVYEADLAMSGAETGEMKLRAAFSRMSWTEPPKLLFEKAGDGKPKSYGYASYKGVTLRVEDMRE